MPLLILSWHWHGVEDRHYFLVRVFEVIVNTSAGVRAIDRNVVRTARSFGADDFQIFRTVLLPGSVPFIVTGLTWQLVAVSSGWSSVSFMRLRRALGIA